MRYELAQYFYKKVQGIWIFWKKKGFFGKIFFLPVMLVAGFCLCMSLFLFVASFMTILENIARSIFFFFKRKMSKSGCIGRVFYFPFFITSIAICVFVIVFSIGSALPFKEK